MESIIERKISDLGSKQTTIRFNQYLYDAIAAEAKQRGVKKAQVINERVAAAYGIDLANPIPSDYKV